MGVPSWRRCSSLSSSLIIRRRVDFFSCGRRSRCSGARSAGSRAAGCSTSRRSSSARVIVTRRDAGRGAARPRRRDLPVGVRPAAGAAGPQADPRGPRRHAERVVGFFAIAFIDPNMVREHLRASRRATRRCSPPASPSACWSSRSSPRSPRTRCGQCPMSLREARTAAARGKVDGFRVVFPAAVSGIIAAFILAISRAIGETMVDAIAAGCDGVRLFHGWTPLPGRISMTGAMANAAGRQRPGAGDNRPSRPVLRRAGALLDHLAAQLRRRPLRAARPRRSTADGGIAWLSSLPPPPAPPRPTSSGGR